MDIHKIRPHVWAVIPKGDVVPMIGCNVGLIRTNQGFLLIDTSVSTKRMNLILDAVEVQARDVSMIIHTHLHADHINGDKLFKKCPIIFHRKGEAIMAKKIRLQDQQSLVAFDNVHEITFGNTKLELIHLGGHTPESIVVWLPQERVLFAGDLIFSGRAPFMASETDFDVLVEALNRLLTFEADVIIPGHGPLCNDTEVQAQLTYLQRTWEIVKDHVEKRHSLKVVYKDSTLPGLPGRNYERNIEWIYKRMMK